MNQTYKIPPRKWYTLEQASQFLTDEIGQTVTVEDLIHFLFMGAFLPYIQVKYEINNYLSFNNKYRIELDNTDNLFLENMEQSEKFTYDDVKILSDYCNVAIQGVQYPVNYTTKWLEPFVDNLLNKMQSEFGELNDETIEIIDKFFLKYKKLVFGIDGLLAVKIDCLYNGTPLMSEEFDFINNGIKIKEQEFLSPPLINLKNKMLLFTLKVKDEFYIEAKDLIIVYDDLLRVKHGFRANLKGFAEYADEQGKMPPEIPQYFIEWEEKEKNEQKTIEKTEPRMEKSEIKKPIQYAKDYAKDLVIGSCLATRKDYPTAGKNTIVKAVLKKLTEDPTLKGIKFQSERTYTNILDRMEILFPDEKGKTIEISKVTIVTP